jgi:hypothetical protein
MTDTWDHKDESPYAVRTPNPHPGDDSSSEGGRLPTPAMPQPRPDEARPDPTDP